MSRYGPILHYITEPKDVKLVSKKDDSIQIPVIMWCVRRYTDESNTIREVIEPIIIDQKTGCLRVVETEDGEFDQFQGYLVDGELS